VIFGAVVDVLRGVQPQTIQMELVDPVAGVAMQNSRTGPESSPSKLMALPQSVVFSQKNCGANFCDVVAVGAEMIVDHVQDHAQAERMRPIHEAAKVVGRSIDMRGREPLHAVITPAESARKFGHRHHFQNSDAGFGKMRQLSLGAAPGALPW
jgi:hypothetical protein